MSAEWTLGLFVTIIIGMAGIIVWFIRRYIDGRDDDKKMINDLCESVAAITAKQEGQLSFAKALIDQQSEITEIKINVKALHLRLDDIYDIVKGMIK